MATGFLKSGVIAASLLVACNANAGPNLVTNGSFETGDFTGWTANAVSYPMYTVTSPVEDGVYAAQIAGFSFGPDTLSQTIATTAGQTYTLSFWRYQQVTGPNTFLDVTWNGATAFSETILTVGDIAYQNFTATVVGTGSDTLTFSSANDPGWTYVDNVVVSAPELSTWAMMLLGFGGLGFAGYRRAPKKVPSAV
jgi:hypothetical protein